MTYEFRELGIFGVTARSDIPPAGGLRTSLTRKMGAPKLVSSLCKTLFLLAHPRRLAAFV